MNFLQVHELGALVDTFVENHIDYSILTVLSAKDVEDLVKPLGLKIRLNMALKALHQNLENDVNNGILLKTVSEASTIIIDETPVNNVEIKLDENLSVVEGIDLSLAKFSKPTLSEQLKDPRENIIDEDVQSPSRQKILCRSNFFLDNLTITKLLQKSSKGQTVLRVYNEKECFDSKDRRFLVEIIIDALLDRHSSVRSAMLNEVAAEIVSTFPKETLETYYSYNPLLSKNPRGKLVDKYKSERGYRKKNNTPENLPTCSETQSASPEIVGYTKWLQHSQEPWPKVQCLWLKTYASRKSDCESGKSLSEVFEKWPLFKHRSGYTLVSIHCNVLLYVLYAFAIHASKHCILSGQ